MIKPIIPYPHSVEDLVIANVLYCELGVVPCGECGVEQELHSDDDKSEFRVATPIDLMRMAGEEDYVAKDGASHYEDRTAARDLAARYRRAALNLRREMHCPMCGKGIGEIKIQTPDDEFHCRRCEKERLARGE